MRQVIWTCRHLLAKAGASTSIDTLTSSQAHLLTQARGFSAW